MPRYAVSAPAVLALLAAGPVSPAPLSESEVKWALHELSRAGDSAARRDVLREIARTSDKRFAAPLVDLMRFARGRDEQLLVEETLQRLTDTGAQAASWPDMVEWVGRHPELKPPPGYVGWKGLLHAAIDPRFAEFLREGAPARCGSKKCSGAGCRSMASPHSSIRA